MMDFSKTHMVPQTTQSMAKGAASERQRQSKAYSKDMSNNKRQMDDLRHHQYSRQAKAVNSQKSQMQRNAAKSSRMVTGSTAYNKEEFTLQDFIEICEGRKPSTSKKKRGRTENDKNRRRNEAASKAIDKLRANRNEGDDGTNRERRKPDVDQARTSGYERMGHKLNTKEKQAAFKRRLKRGSSAVTTKKERTRREKVGLDAKSKDEAREKERSSRIAHHAAREKYWANRGVEDEKKKESKRKVDMAKWKHKKQTGTLPAQVKREKEAAAAKSEQEKKKKERDERNQKRWRQAGDAVKTGAKFAGKGARLAHKAININKDSEIGGSAGFSGQANRATVVND